MQMKYLISLACIVMSLNIVVIANEAIRCLVPGGCEKPLIIAQRHVIKPFIEELTHIEMAQKMGHYEYYQDFIERCKTLTVTICNKSGVEDMTAKLNEIGRELQQIEMDVRSNPNNYINCFVMLKKYSNSHSLLKDNIPACYNPNYDLLPLFGVTEE